MNEKIDKKFIVRINNKDFVKYDGLLDLAHENIQKMDVEILQFPADINDNTAICKAIITTKDDRIFTDIGDANIKSCTKMVAAHFIRMASTRAKARALRDYTNIGMVCAEELGEGEKKNNNCKPQTSEQQKDDPGEPPICSKHNRRMKLITLDSGHKFWSCTAKDKDGKNGYCNNSQDIPDAKKPDKSDDIGEPPSKSQASELQSEKLKENLAHIKKLRIELGWKRQSLRDILPEWKGANLDTESGTRVLIAYLNTEIEKKKACVITEAADDELPFP